MSLIRLSETFEMFIIHTVLHNNKLLPVYNIEML